MSATQDAVTKLVVEKARRLVDLINGAEQRHQWEYQQLLCAEEFARALVILSEREYVPSEDAARYRWIKDNGVSVKAPGLNPYPLKWMLTTRGRDIATAEDLDFAVDSAISSSRISGKRST